MSSETHLGETPTLDEQIEILKTCCDYESPTSQDWEALLPDYATYYEAQRKQIKLQHGPKGANIWTFPIRSHQQLLRVVRLIQDNENPVTRTEMREEVRKLASLGSVSPEQLDDVIDLALRVWLMINFRCEKDIGVGGGRPCVQWVATRTLAEELEGLFERSTTELTLSERRLSRHFTAANLMSICGLKIEWTTSLEDHLRLDSQHKTLWVFCHRRFLVMHAAPRKASR